MLIRGSGSCGKDKEKEVMSVASDIKTLKNLLDQLGLVLEIYTKTGNADKAIKQLETVRLQTEKEMLKAMLKQSNLEMLDCLSKLKGIESGIAYLLLR